MAIIEKPLNVFDIANTLGYYEYAPHPVTGQTVRKVDVGRLCTHENINKWAKYKPVRHPSKTELTPQQFKDLNYGIDLPIYSNVQSMISSMTGIGGQSPQWSYLKPRGGANNEWFRVADFNHYSDRGQPPFGGMFITRRAATNGGNKEITGSLFIAQPGLGQIGWDDLNLSGRKLGMALIRVSDSLLKTKVAQNVGDSEVTMHVDFDNIPVGTYNGFLFLTNPYGGLTQIAGLHNHQKMGFLVSVVTEFVSVMLTARWLELEPNKVSISVSAINTTAGAVNLLNSRLSVRFSGNECDSTIQQHEYLNAIGTISVPPTDQWGTLVYSEEVLINRDENPSWKVCWGNTGIYPNQIEANIIQEM